VSDETEHFQDVQPLFPFTVIGSNTIIEYKGDQTRGRKYRWGTVAVTDEDHCDFVHLRRMIMDNCLYDLIDTTQRVHYAHYRATQLRAHGRRPSVLQCDEAYESRIEETKVSLQEEMFKKEEEMRQNFVTKVREKEQELRQREESLLQKRNQLMQELEEEKNQLEVEERDIDVLLGQNGIKMMSIFGKK
jgi:septin family protein